MDDETSGIRLDPWPLFTATVVAWVLVALASLAAALLHGRGPGLESMPWEVLVSLELLSLGVWVALSLPGLVGIRAAIRPVGSRSARVLVAMIGGVVFSLLFAAIEPFVLRFVVHSSQIPFARSILPHFDTRIFAFVFMAAMVRSGPTPTRRPPITVIGTPRKPGGSSLVTQLQSHFLFNSLNEAAELVHVDPDAADEFITRLSEFLRRALVHTGRELVPLRWEVEFIQAYIEVQASKLRGRVSVTWEIQEETLDAVVPIFVWQPLLENSFRYGADPTTGQLTLEIGADREGADLMLWIRDHGAGLGQHRPPNGHGIGLRNTRERMARLYGDDGWLQVRSLDAGVLALLRLPFCAVREAAPTQVAG